jgi:anti-sigma factor RsiW
MTCREVIETLMAYLDGELSPAARQAFDDHLHDCPACIRYLDSYRATINLTRQAHAAANTNPMSTAAAASPSPDLPERILAALRAARVAGAQRAPDPRSRPHG